MKNKTEAFVTETLEVKWSHLHKPDDKFGVEAANHNITIILDDALEQKLEELQQELGCSKVNGMKAVDDTMTLKAKTKLYVKKDIKCFPCVDANASATDALPFNGDKVKLKLFPMIIDRDNSLSLFLNGIQIIEKSDRDFDSGGFEPTEGFDGSTVAETVPESTDTDTDDDSTDDLPF